MSIPAQLRNQVYHLDKQRCAYCRTPQELVVTTFEVDHIAPLSAGGETSLQNLCLACPACNRYKGARQTAIDPETGQDVPLYHPRREKWELHFEWNPTTFQVIGRTPTGRATIEMLRMNRPALVRLRRLWARLGFALEA